ncbi:hypothetical protein EBZ02_05765 [bacterium]|nr:hypothetical protein [bacterium]NDA10372.1 hypothetical protein [Verrucomicrobiota bacterium]NDD82090.1 hypothetical protein [Verrucomicrobiota bacterium]
MSDYLYKFKLEIRTNTEAFGDRPELELSRIFSWLSKRILNDPEEITIVDINGNTVGKATLR